MYVIVVGGGKVGYHLTRRLVEEGHEVLLIEKDKKKYGDIVDELGEIVLWGDGCEMRTMKEAGMERADVVAAVTGHDEDNLVISQMAQRKFGVPRVIARINNPKNEDIFHRLGIKDTVNSTNIIYTLIDQEVEAGDLIRLLPLRRGAVEIVEVEILDNSPVLDKKVKDIRLPKDSIIVSVIRDDRVILPRGDTKFSLGDTVLALTTMGKEQELHDVLVGVQKIERK